MVVRPRGRRRRGLVGALRGRAAAPALLAEQELHLDGRRARRAEGLLCARGPRARALPRATRRADAERDLRRDAHRAPADHDDRARRRPVRRGVRRSRLGRGPSSRRRSSTSPGSHFVYNTAATYLLVGHRAAGHRAARARLPGPRLLEPLGIVGATWEQCPQGVDAGGFGLSHAHRGRRLLRPALPARRRLGRPAAAAGGLGRRRRPRAQTSRPAAGDPDWVQGYGYQFWRGRTPTAPGSRVTAPSASSASCSPSWTPWSRSRRASRACRRCSLIASGRTWLPEGCRDSGGSADGPHDGGARRRSARGSPAAGLDPPVAGTKGRC